MVILKDIMDYSKGRENQWTELSAADGRYTEGWAKVGLQLLLWKIHSTRINSVFGALMAVNLLLPTCVCCFHKIKGQSQLGMKRGFSGKEVSDP